MSCTSPIPNTIARSAGSTSTPTCRIWLPLAAITPIASWRWRCGWWSKTGSPTAVPVGICGATIACLSRLPPSRTGWRPGGKRASLRMATDYLDWALADFSGYLAADELYDGPFCVLSIVDNRSFKRLGYQVLDHDPSQADVATFFRQFRAVLAARQLVV